MKRSHSCDAVVEQHGRIDVLIKNSGGSTWAATDTLAEAEFDRELRLNLYAALFCSQRAIHYMKPAGGGLILSQIMNRFCSPLSRAPATIDGQSDPVMNEA